VADDVVIARRVAHDQAVGSPDPPIKYLMEVRGLGIINIKDLFGIAAVKSEISIDLALKLGILDGRSEFDRLGIRQEFFDVLGVQVPMFKIPVSSGRNLASIIEVAVRNFLVRQEGYVATHSFRRQGVEIRSCETEDPVAVLNYENGYIISFRRRFFKKNDAMTDCIIN
jgi:HPr kinase/phosphorylase